MSEAKHTPGPWRKSGVIIKGANGEAVCFLSQRNDDHRKPDGELEANARLIAAAPKLLEALEVIVAAFDGDIADALKAAQAAIAEAKGEL